MTAHRIAGYPKTVRLRDHTSVTLRPMTAADADALLAFFQRVPDGDRAFLRHDVTAPGVIRAWAEGLDYDRTLPLLALAGDRVVADATLTRYHTPAGGEEGEVRVVVDAEYRGRGLGSILIRELTVTAYNAELEQVTFEFIKGAQDDAAAAAAFVGAIPFRQHALHAEAPRGPDHDVVALRLPLGAWWDRARL